MLGTYSGHRHVTATRYDHVRADVSVAGQRATTLEPHNDAQGADVTGKPRIAVFSGPTATIQNTPPLVSAGDGPIPRAQRLATSAVVYVEAQSAHPLEADALDLYGPPDGYISTDGSFVALEGAVLPEGAKGVYRLELDPSVGLLFLPYVATTVSGEPWAATTLFDFAPEESSRQTFYPDASRLYEEIDTFGLDHEGRNHMLTSAAAFDFIRAIPSGGWRSEAGALAAGLDSPERRGEDYFGYFPQHLHTEPGPANLARATNLVQETLASGEYLGAQWLEGSPTTEETMYWLNLLIDTEVPIVGHSAQRPHGSLGADGDHNILDGVRYITSKIWADSEGRDRIGAVMIVDEVIYASREVTKTDARPGNYVATGGHGGILGTTGAAFGSPVLTYAPVRRHTANSEVRISLLPYVVPGTARTGSGGFESTSITVKDGDGMLVPSAMPTVEIVKYARYADPCCGPSEVDALISHFASAHPLAGIVCEGMNPYGAMNPSTDDALKVAALSGFPIVRVGRGNTAGFTSAQPPWFVRGTNLTSTKARLLLIACLLRFGALPPAVDAANPTDEELKAIIESVAAIQAVFDSH